MASSPRSEPTEQPWDLDSPKRARGTEPSRVAAEGEGQPSAAMREEEIVLPELRICRLKAEARLPAYAHEGDAGLDLFACEAVRIPPGGIARVGTGVAVELPPGTEGQVRPRSGLAARCGVTVLNAPGTVDEGYRGEVAVLLINHGREPFQVLPGMRIAQLVVAPVVRVRVVEAEQLTDSTRGTGGFGSTGVGSEGR